MQYRSGNEIRELFLRFWESKGSRRIQSAPLVPDDPSLLFTIAGMVPFKKYYLGLQEPPCASAVTVQKCVRTNDIDNVGRTARHHTFFEMLGNFSWGGHEGSYFKRESLTGGFQFLTDVIGMDPARMYATVYDGDDETYAIWTKEIKLPESHIVLNGDDPATGRAGSENFWHMGSQGPCGPDSEIMYDQGEEYSCGPSCHPGCDCDRYLEIWNHVFTQYNRAPDGTYAPLPRRNIDTGMGLERLTSLVQGVRNDFETDLFTPIMAKAGQLAGVRYGDAPESDHALKVISDHVRSVCFMIADGILPSNEGRGYVLRRLLRRASRYGRLIGILKPFISDVIPVVIDQMGTHYPELPASRLTIEKIISQEETGFDRTIQQGSELLQSEIQHARTQTGQPTLNGAAAFQLYDTYGFPLELTQEICAEQGVHVDETGFRAEMQAQRTRAREGSRQKKAVMHSTAFTDLHSMYGATPFTGWQPGGYEVFTKVLAIAVRDTAPQAEGEPESPAWRLTDTLNHGASGMVLLDRSPFYAERGGQTGDTGLLESTGGGSEGADGSTVAIVENTTHPYGELIMQTVTVTKGRLTTGMPVRAAVETERHLDIARNHTATHMLHAALVHVLGGHVRQAGSLVNDRFLRFDYTHFEPLSPEQLEEAEALVNRAIIADLPVATAEMSLEAAKATGAKALFEEKYGDRVRVVTIGAGYGENGAPMSSELCGGTHVDTTGEIGLFKIVSDEGIGSGTRRITAMTGMNSCRAVQEMFRTAHELSDFLNVRPVRFVEKVLAMEQELKDLRRQLDTVKRQQLTQTATHALSSTPIPGGFTLYTGILPADTPDALREACDSVKDSDPAAVIVAASTANQRVSLLAMLGSQALEAKLHAGRIVKEVAAICGGSGGGRPAMAQAGARDASKVSEALAAVPAIVTRMLGR